MLALPLTPHTTYLRLLISYHIISYVCATCSVSLYVQVSVAVKWSSVVLAAGGGGGDARYDDGDNDGGDRSRNASSASLSTGDASSSSPPDRDAAGRRAAFSGMRLFSGVREGGLETAGVGAKRKCLPIHFGRLSCSAEAGVKDGSSAVEVNERFLLLFLFLRQRNGFCCQCLHA